MSGHKTGKSLRTRLLVCRLRIVPTAVLQRYGVVELEWKKTNQESGKLIEESSPKKKRRRKFTQAEQLASGRIGRRTMLSLSCGRDLVTPESYRPERRRRLGLWRPRGVFGEPSVAAERKAQTTGSLPAYCLCAALLRQRLLSLEAEVVHLFLQQCTRARTCRGLSCTQGSPPKDSRMPRGRGAHGVSGGCSAAWCYTCGWLPRCCCSCSCYKR